MLKVVIKCLKHCLSLDLFWFAVSLLYKLLTICDKMVSKVEMHGFSEPLDEKDKKLKAIDVDLSQFLS